MPTGIIIIQVLWATILLLFHEWIFAVWHHSWGDVTKHLLAPETELIADHSTDTTKVQFGKLVSFIEVTYRNTGERLLMGAELTWRQPHHQSPPWLRCQPMKTGNLEHVEVLQQLSRLGGVFFRSLGWSEPLPRKLDWSWFFMVFGWSLLLPGYQWTWPLLGSSAGLTVSLSNPYCLRGHGDRGTSKCGQFQGFSEALLNCVLSELKEFPPQAGEFHLPLEQNPAVSPPCKHSF